ncbi:MAG TPA: hypothetical protein PLP48_00540 [Acholeplasmataceae bacterium]|jgi:hypothetical protein|nr:hypothetical protein [Acholeplasmataceae bacterium]
MHEFQREPWHIRWYNYNKYSIPVILTVIGTLIFTMFLDFRTSGINFESHITAINQLTNKVVGFYLFAIYMIALVQLANVLSYKKKRSPLGLFFFTFMNALQCLLVYLYINVFYTEVQIRTDGYTIPSFGQFSINVMITGAIFYVLATLFAWFYVDWKYVKIEE